MVARTLAGLVVAMASASLLHAQDMPLSQILIDGEGWTKGMGKPAEVFSHSDGPIDVVGAEKVMHFEQYVIGSRKFHVFYSSFWKPIQSGKRTAGVVTPDGGTVYIAGDEGFIWGYQVKERGELVHGHPYCAVRVPFTGGIRGKVDPINQPSRVSAMTVDNDGRIYAATPLGVQVFDPTGRLCGVLTPAASGKVEHMAFEGDHLAVWIGEDKFVRKLNTTGLAP